MISLHHLRYFLAAADTMHIANAAKRVRITPSALSQAIVGLERDLGTSLVVHQRKKFELTPAGQLLKQRGPSILQSVTALRNDLALDHDVDGGEFTFITQQSIASAILPKKLVQFSQQWPNSKVGVQIGVRESVIAEIFSGNVAFGLSVNLERHNPELNYEVVSEGKYIIVGERSDVKKSENIDLSLAHFIMSDFETKEVKLFLKLYRSRFGHSAEVVQTIKSWSVAAEMAAAGLGLAMVPEFVLQRPFGKAKSANIIPWPFAEEIFYQIEVIWPKKSSLCSCSQRFIRLLKIQEI